MQVLALGLPILNQLTIDEAITKGDKSLLDIIAIGMIILIISTAGIRVLQAMVGLYMGTQLSFQLETNLLRHALRLPVIWFEKHHIGDILSRFESLKPIRGFVLDGIPSAILNTVVSIVCVIMMIIYSPLLALLEFGIVFIELVIRLVLFPYIRRRTDEVLQSEGNLNTTFLETIRGARSFKTFGRESERVAVWQNEKARLVNGQVSLARMGIWGSAGTAVISGIQQTIVWFIGAKMVIANQISLGMLFAFKAYAIQFGAATLALTMALFVYKTVGLHLERLSDIAHAEQEEGLDVITMHGRQVQGRISAENITFRYSDADPVVLENISLDISPGEFVCFQGPSGQGKTTLLKILMGFENSQDGKVLVDGVPLRNWGITTFRNQIGVLLQDDQLFAGTIADNICFFATNPAQQDIENAARASGVHDEIASLPMGYQTFTGDLGSSLSAGQRQRVLLARALFRKPKILFLDEGAANLDPVSECLVMNTIRNLDITRVTVAHRAEATEGASRVIRVDQGKLVEAGRLG